MESEHFLKQKVFKLDDLEDGDEFVYSDDLLGLLKNAEVRSYLSNKYDLSKNIKIKIAKIDALYKLVKQYSTHFSLIRLTTRFDKVHSYFATNSDGLRDVYFDISEGLTKSDGLIYKDIKAKAIYDAVNMFYEGRKLTQYVNFLKKRTRGDSLLAAVNESWNSLYSKSNSKNVPEKVFRILDDGKHKFLKSINTDRYNEYGITETFVLTMLELNKILRTDLAFDFKISSLAISESKIEIILTRDSPKKIEGIGTIHPSISIRNEDQGNTSIGYYSTLEFKLSKLIDGKLYLFPNKRIEDIKVERTMSHVVGVEYFVDNCEGIRDFFQEYDNFKGDYHLFKQSVDLDELRAKIEEKLISRNSPFKEVRSLQELFTRKNAGHIANLASLLRLCGKAELLDMDFDLKFKLRYLISNVLLYGRNDL